MKGFDCFLNVLSSLVLLVFLNMMLFYKLWMLEYSAQSLTTWQSLRLQERYREILCSSVNKNYDRKLAVFGSKMSGRLNKNIKYKEKLS